MSKLLAVSWDSNSLRYVLAETRKRGEVQVLNAGEKPIDEASDSDAPSVVEQLSAVIRELKASRAKLILCVGRGSVDSARFTVPPATDAELPTLVQNMAQRQLTALGEDATIDFVSFPPLDDGSRQVSAMAMAAADEQLVDALAEVSGCTNISAVVVTHPLRIFAPPLDDGDRSATLVVSKGLQSAHILLLQHQRPVLSRTLRLAPGASREVEAQFISGEIQRTILTIGDQLERGVEITNAVLVGSMLETEPLAEQLNSRINAEVTLVSANSLIEGNVDEAAQGAWAPLIAAVCESANETTPAIDFRNPKRPPKSDGRRNQLITIAAALLLICGGGWYYVDSMFAEWHEKIALLKPDLDSMKDNVRKTSSMRRQASGLLRWERSRMNWLDEIRDLTIRMPSSPDISVRQFAATPSGSGFTVTFQGTSRSPEVHRAMEVGIQDRYHTTRTPSFSESRKGKDVVWNFRTTLQIKKHSNKEYTSHKKLESLQKSADTVVPKKSSKASPAKADAQPKGTQS
jgi:hypothetical protein